jgi:hypothetical protein
MNMIIKSEIKMFRCVYYIQYYTSSDEKGTGSAAGTKEQDIK